jgi:hypothetical protein
MSIFSFCEGPPVEK